MVIMRKGLVILGFILILIHIVIYIIFSFGTSYHLNQINENERIIQEYYDGIYSEEHMANTNISYINDTISNQKNYYNGFNSVLWISILFSIIGIILIIYGCSINPNLNETLDLLKILGTISIIFGIIILPIGYLFSHQQTPFGYNEEIEDYEKRTSNDFIITGFIFLIIGLSLIIIQRKIIKLNKVSIHNNKSTL